MSYETKPGDFSLFINRDKKDANQPDYTGKIMLPDGTEMRMAGWLKTPQAGGSQFISGKISEPQARTTGPVEPVQGFPTPEPIQEAKVISAPAQDGLPF